MFRLVTRSIRTHLRRYTNDITGASPKPFSEIPSPSGALPVLGHYFRIRNEFSKNVDEMFEEINGPIFKIKIVGMSLNYTVNYILVQCAYRYAALHHEYLQSVCMLYTDAMMHAAQLIIDVYE